MHEPPAPPSLLCHYSSSSSDDAPSSSADSPPPPPAGLGTSFLGLGLVLVLRAVLRAVLGAGSAATAGVEFLHNVADCRHRLRRGALAALDEEVLQHRRGHSPPLALLGRRLLLRCLLLLLRVLLLL